MSERAPYSRIYWTVRNDPRLTGIYGDDHHWATWSRLLLDADMAWPAPASLPASAKRASVKALEAAGVIELLPGGLFTFHGLDTERGRRRDAAASSAAMRTHTERSPSADRTHTERSPSADRTHTERDASAMLDETRRDKQRVNGVLGKEGARAITARGPSEAVS